jgi:hypothetical protein
VADSSQFAFKLELKIPETEFVIGEQFQFQMSGDCILGDTDNAKRIT